MKVLSAIFIFIFLCVHIGMSNNVRILGNVRVLDSDVDKDTGIAKVKLRVEWDNSWRDAFNYDAVYVFLKYKVDGPSKVWHHAYLMNTGNKVSEGYDYWLSNTTGEKDKNQGIFVFHSGKVAKNAGVDLELSWLITSNPDEVLSREQFTSGSVFLSAMGIEMVYVPRGAFRAGDTQSSYKFEYKDVTLPAVHDVLSETTIENCESSVNDPLHPASFAINRMNDISKDNSNAWVGRSSAGAPGDWYDYWKVTLKAPTIIKNIAIESIEGGTPVKWQFQGLNTTSGEWQTLYPKYGDNSVFADGSDWAVNSHRTYPCTRTLRLEAYTTKYQTYRIKIVETSRVPVIKNISMSEKDIFEDVDNSVLVYSPQTTMSDRVGLYADDSDNWSGKTGTEYPNGYGAFFVMKYEISQEQYVAFLNKLTASQQRARTIGSALESLKPGDYVFGPDRDKPSARNGIKLSVGSTDNAPYVFANDLEPLDEYAQDGDGQTLACNYLNAGDMMAYADWCGLRPMTELEFEKMSRRPFPEPALRGEYAWNTNDRFEAATDFEVGTAGKKSERLTKGNVNAENKLKGPVRSGAFAKGNEGSQVDAGASFWGVMDLSGNLAEIFYNVNTEGRAFCGVLDVQHGDGKLNAGGVADVSNRYWPVEPKAFALRGGSFKDNCDRTRISDREKHWGVFNTVNEVSGLKDSTMTFRVGRTAPVLTVVSELTLENGLTSASAPVDSICSGSDYVITGEVPPEITGAFRIAWFQSSDQGKTWDLLEGEEFPSLKLYNLRNINSKEDIFKEYWYSRYIYSNSVDVVQSKPVRLLVINRSLSLSRYRDTVDVYDYSKGIRLEVSQAATFQWSWVRDRSGAVPITPEYTVKPGKIQLHYFKYTDFYDGTQYTGDQKVVIRLEVMNKCALTDTVHVFVEGYPTERNNVNNDATKSINRDFNCGDILIDNEENIPKYNKYRTIKIGNKCWFADNLNRVIPAGGKGLARCYDDMPKNCETYGRLYNFFAVTQQAAPVVLPGAFQGICPKGWHVPTNPEWLELLAAIGEQANTAGNAGSIKSSLNNWNFASISNNENLIGNNSSRFGALPNGGHLYSNNTAYSTRWNEDGATPERTSRNGFYDIRERAWWWTSTMEDRYWTTHHTGCFNDALIPFHITMDNTTNTIYNNYAVAWNCYGYIWRSVFGGVYPQVLNPNYNSGGGYNSGNNAVATQRIWNEFYMGVRCVRD